MPQFEPILPGAFVTIEGIDGSGKSTLAAAVATLDGIAERPIHLIHKSSSVGEDYVARHADGLREVLWGERSEQRRSAISDMHWLWLAAAWFALVEEVEVVPRIRRGFVVVSDSWFDKILARFSLKNSAIAEHAASIGSTLRRPDWTLLLDVSPTVAADRKQEFGYSECGNFDGLEGRSHENFVAYQERVRHAYLGLAASRSWSTAHQPVTAVEFASRMTKVLGWE